MNPAGGNWRIEDTGGTYIIRSDDLIVKEHPATNNLTVKSDVAVCYITKHCIRDEGQVAANARLIVKAFHMSEALRQIKEIMATIQYDDGTSEEPDIPTADRIVKICNEAMP